MASPSRQALRPPQAAKKLGIGLSTLWMKIKHEPGFPQPFKLSMRITVLFEDELDAWMAAAAAKRFHGAISASVSASVPVSVSGSDAILCPGQGTSA